MSVQWRESPLDTVLNQFQPSLILTKMSLYTISLLHSYLFSLSMLTDLMKWSRRWRKWHSWIGITLSNFFFRKKKNQRSSKCQRRLFHTVILSSWICWYKFVTEVAIFATCSAIYFWNFNSLVFLISVWMLSFSSRCLSSARSVWNGRTIGGLSTCFISETGLQIWIRGGELWACVVKIIGLIWLSCLSVL